MKKELKNKLIFISGVVFALALLFVSVQWIRAATTNSWSAPKLPFPQANVYPPIDTGPDVPSVSNPKGLAIREGKIELGGMVWNEKTKTSVFQSGVALFLQKNSSIGNIFGSFYPEDGSGNATIFSSKALNLSTAGLLLPRDPIVLLDGTTAIKTPEKQEGMIYYDTTKKGVKLYDGTSWKDIGSGGGGDSFWKPTAGGIAYSGSGVTINSLNSGWWYEETKTVSMKGGNSISLVNTAQAKFERKFPPMSCDRDETKPECTENYYSGTGDEREGSYASDRFEEYSYSCPAKSSFGSVYKLYEQDRKCCDAFNENTNQPSGCISATRNIAAVKEKIYKFYTKEAALPAQLTVVGDVKANTANIGTVNVADINLSNPQYSKTTGEIYMVVEKEPISIGEFDQGWATCPPGYFVNAFRFGINGASLAPVLKCSKL